MHGLFNVPHSKKIYKNCSDKEWFGKLLKNIFQKFITIFAETLHQQWIVFAFTIILYTPLWGLYSQLMNTIFFTFGKINFWKFKFSTLNLFHFQLFCLTIFYFEFLVLSNKSYNKSNRITSISTTTTLTSTASVYKFIS